MQHVFFIFFYFEPETEAADAVERLYCTRDKVERSGVMIPVSPHRGLQPGQLDPPQACASSPSALASVLHPNVLPRSADTALRCLAPSAACRLQHAALQSLHSGIYRI